MKARTNVWSAVVTSVFLGVAGQCYGQLNFAKTTITLPATGAESMTADFPFEIGGANPVVIGEVKADCSCSGGTLEKHDYQPGEKGSIKFEFRVGNYSGPQEKRLYVVASDQADPHVLTLLTDLPVVVDISPRTVYWDHAAPLTPKVITVTVGSGQPSLVSLDATSDSPAVTVVVKEVTPGRKFEVSLTPTATSQVLVAKVDLRANYENKREKAFSCFAMVKPPPE